ncbi:MAG TPA: hypothetical protein VFV37_11010 [Luteibaculaceae bacterium]|nr:hypothetical protein [Luteibaculaceae bacterium]
MKETAIDWLIKKIDLDNLNPTQIQWREAIDEAKRMQKAQIIKAMLDGAYCNMRMTKEIAELYYYETYEKGR